MTEFNREMKKKIEGHQITPSAALWDRLEENLDKTNLDDCSTLPPETQIIGRRFFWTSIAASITILFGFSTWLFQDFLIVDSQNYNVVELRDSSSYLEMITPKEIPKIVLAKADRLSFAPIPITKSVAYLNAISPKESVLNKAEIIESNETFKVSKTEVQNFQEKNSLSNENSTSENIELYINDTVELYQAYSETKSIKEESNSETIRIEYIPGKKRRLLKKIFTKINVKP